MRLGVIGFGGRMQGVFRTLRRMEREAQLVAVTDPRKEEIKEELGTEADGVAFFDDADRMLDSVELDGVMIGTRCSLHTHYAVKVAERRLPLYLEKPVATTMEDLKRLHAAFKKSGTGDKVVVSFPLRLTYHVQLAKEMIEAGEIGTLEHVQAVNNVPYGGRAYFQGWYRDWDETHGLWLQKATHDLDYIAYLFGQRPVRAAGMMSQRVLGPAGKRSVGFTMPMEQACRDCPRQEECPESPYNKFYRLGEGEDVTQGETFMRRRPTMCMFGDGIKNQDNGSCLVEFESGAQAVYTQNFFVRRQAAFRGATLIGYRGSIQFDWYSNTFRLVYHHRTRVENVELASRSGHGGGDLELVRSFVKVIRDGEPSRSPLDAGIWSAYLCLKVDESCRTGRFVTLSPEELES